MDFIAITAASKPWESPLSGFIGVGPYTMTPDVNKQKTNFMLQLKTQGLIENNIISFYVRANNDTLSHIKFGSWDRQKTEANLEAVITMNGLMNWQIEAHDIFVGEA